MLQSLGTTYVSVQLSTQYRSASWCSAETSWFPVCVHCLLSWHWAQQLKRAWLHPLCTFPSSIYRHWWDPAKPPLLQAVGCTALCLFSLKRSTRPFITFTPAYSGLSHTRRPALHTAVQLWPHLPQPAGNVLLKAAQGYQQTPPQSLFRRVVPSL